MGNQENIVRSVLKSEITWILFLVGGIMGFVTTVILPLQSIQMQISQIQKDLLEQRGLYVNFDIRLTSLEKDNIRYHSSK